MKPPLNLMRSIPPEVPEGWKRDFLVHSVGWVKDGDLNTAEGQKRGTLALSQNVQLPLRA